MYVVLELHHNSMGVLGVIFLVVASTALSAPVVDGAAKGSLQMVLEVQHAVDAAPFQPRGYITLSRSEEEQIRLGTSTTIPFSDSIQTDMESALRNSAIHGGDYRLRARMSLLQNNDTDTPLSHSNWMYTVTKACSLVTSDYKHAIAIQQDVSELHAELASSDTVQAIRSFQQAVKPLRSTTLRLPKRAVPCFHADEKLLNHQEFTGVMKGRVEFHSFSSSVVSEGFGEEPAGDGKPYPGQRKLYSDGSGNAVKSQKKMGEIPEEEQTFMQRYGYIIIPAAIAYLVLNLFAPAPEEGGAAGAQQTSR
eukprot:gb/GECG01001287.1/.p1 GENE.gb/GECG01001287.1/~~gb/GECG01001287.1/.p1  ORF type:complete len:307 (+),score=39.71 gb/GECG01001287.1/:1-921(+)